MGSPSFSVTAPALGAARTVSVTSRLGVEFSNRKGYRVYALEVRPPPQGFSQASFSSIRMTPIPAGRGEMIDYALMHSGTILFAAIAGGETNNQKEMRRGSHSSIITAKPLYTELGNWLMAKRASCRLTVALLAAWLAPCALPER